jgi:hypothetical protein
MRMGHESMKKTWGCRKSYTQEKRTMLAEPAKIRHFPLAPVSVGWVPERYGEFATLAFHRTVVMFVCEVSNVGVSGVFGLLVFKTGISFP